MYCNLCRYCKEAFLNSKPLDICQSCYSAIHPTFKDLERVASSITAQEAEIMYTTLTSRPYSCSVHFIKFMTTRKGLLKILYDVYVPKTDIIYNKPLREYIDKLNKDEKKD